VFQPLRAQRVFEGVVEQVRDAIASGNMQAGDRLPAELELARQFQVSRATVREAMRVLELTGLVTIRPGAGGGVFVADAFHRPLSAAFETIFRLERLSISEFYRARIALEGLVAQVAAEEATQADIAELEATVRPQHLPASEMRRELRGFHQVLASTCHNPLLKALVEAMIGVSDTLGMSRRADPSDYLHFQGDHTGIVDAIRRKDPGLARQRMEEHLARVEPDTAARGGRKQTRVTRLRR
jgi:DNA-binding FadR family transcriptional regulator